MCRSVILSSKITHQMWCNHPFSQANKTIQRAVGVELGGNKEERKVAQNLKKEVGNIGGLHEIGGLGSLCQLWCQGNKNVFDVL